MTEHAYSVHCLRYFPNLVSGEFVNVGVFIVAKTTGWWAARIAQDLKDLTCIYRDAQPDALAAVLGPIADRLESPRDAGPSLIVEPADPSDPLAIVRKKVGPLNGSLRWSDLLLEGATGDLDSELEYWFEQLVVAAKPRREAAHVAAEIAAPVDEMKTMIAQEFARRDIITRFRSAELGKYYRQRFDFTYENGSLNVFEPIRLNYKRGGDVTNRGQMWRGRLDMLGEQVGRPLAFFALVDLPKGDELEYEAQQAITMIRHAQVERVETIPSEGIARYGQLALEVVRSGGSTGPSNFS